VGCVNGPMSRNPPEPDTLNPGSIRVTNRARGLNEESVLRLADSISKIGLQTPISVRWAKTDNPDYCTGWRRANV
jgi:ParB-like chromosome segregation protein Spo0J